MRHKSLISLILTLALLPAWIANSDSFVNRADEFSFDIETLAKKSDTIVLGRIMHIKRDSRETRAIVFVSEVFQGDVREGKIVVVARSGTMLQSKLEPEFTKHEKAFFFLNREHIRNQYRCVKGKEGKKPVVEGEVFFLHDNEHTKIAFGEYRRYLIERATLISLK